MKSAELTDEMQRLRTENAVLRSRVQSLEEARIKNVRMQTVVNHCELGIIVWNPEFRVVDWNPAAERIFGYTAEEALGMHGSQLVADSAQAAVDEVWRQLLINRGGFRSTNENLRKGGASIIVDWHNTAIVEKENCASYVVSIFEDVTSDFSNRRDLKEKERLLETVLHAAPVRIWVVGRNSELAFSLGDAGKDGEPTFQQLLMHGPFESALRHAFSGARSHVEIEREGCWNDAYFDPLRDPDGAVTGAIVVMTDVTARRKAERSAEVREETYRALTEALPVMVWRRDIGERATIVNTAFAVFTGHTVEELNRTGIDPLTYIADLRMIASARKRARINNGPVFWEHRFRRWDGEYRWCYAAITPVKDADGRIVSWVGMAVDIHDLRSANEEVVRANQELELRVETRTRDLAATAEQLQQFAYSVSHDLRGPLRSINGFSKALEEDFGDRLGPEGNDYLHRIRSASMRLAALIDSLLWLSQVTRAEMRTKPIDLSALAASVIEDLPRQPLGDDSPADFRIESGLAAEGDEVLLRAVLTNLFDNALKFSANIPHPVIEFGRDAHGFFVRDNGAGFDMLYAEQLFTPFHRLHSGAEFPGHGIGLAVVRRIIARHGGDIWAEAYPGKGATMHFTLRATAG